MAKTWYPVIDYLSCLECGTCVDFCPHGVYDAAKAPSPVVVNPAKCIDHCHGCGNKCPVGAISYVGDNTGWKPASQKAQKETETCCSCGCGQPSEKRVLIEYLYLDLNTCDRCIGTDAVLDEVVTAITPALKLAGFAVDYEKHEMATPELATQYCRWDHLYRSLRSSHDFTSLFVAIHAKPQEHFARCGFNFDSIPIKSPVYGFEQFPRPGKPAK